MNCRRVEQLLPDYLERLLPERPAGAIAAHLADCPGCRRRQRELAALRTDLHRLAELSPPPDLARRALARWATEEERTARSQPQLAAAAPRRLWGTLPPARLVPLGAAAAAALLTVLGLTLTRGHHGGTGGPTTPKIANRSDREQTLSPFVPTGARPPRPADGPRAGSGPQARGSAHDGVRTPVRFAPQQGPSLFRIADGSPHAANPPAATGTLPKPAARPGDDLKYLNSDPVITAQRWAPLSRDEWDALEAKVRRNVRVKDDFVTIPFPRVAATSDRQVVAAVEGYKREAVVVDARLFQEVDLQQKATALSEVCDHLRSSTGIDLTAGPSVADEKMTVFCHRRPLREVMRQLSRPFGFTWLRSSKDGKYRYELVQDLRSQLAEEELRNRDRNETLVALDREMQHYRSFLSLSPDQALARARTAPADEKRLLERLANKTWGAIQMYFRLSPSDLAALRAGQTVTFAAPPDPGEQPLPADIARGVLQSWRDWRIARRGDGLAVGEAKEVPDGLLPAAVPEARAKVTFRLDHSELGQLTLDAGSGMVVGGHVSIITDNLALGMSPAVRSPGNETSNAKLVHDPGLQRRVSVRPESSCGKAGRLVPDSGRRPVVASQDRRSTPAMPAGEKVSSADVLEALHRATGVSIVSDYYTRLYPLGEVTVGNQPLFETLNRLSNAMRLRWNKDGDWLQFRSASFFNDRLKEVPKRLLTRWSASRQQHGALTLDDLIEIAQLSDPQLDSRSMAEGAQECWSLAEWGLARNVYGLRPHLRYLAGLNPAQRRQAQSAAGLPFTQLTLAQQQAFISLALGPHSSRSGSGLEELAGAALRVDYAVPGWFEWVKPAAPDEPRWRALLPSPVRERNREAALQAALRIDSRSAEAQIAPTELALTVAYTWGRPDSGPSAHVVRATPGGARDLTATKQGTIQSTSDISRIGGD